MRILIAEDERIVALDLARRLIGLGHEVVGQTPTGEGAVEKSIQLRPHLVLMDIGLKGTMDGIAAATEILANQNIPIIFVTAYADESTFDRATHVSPYGYLVKPFEDTELQTAIELAIVRRGADGKPT